MNEQTNVLKLKIKIAHKNPIYIVLMQVEFHGTAVSHRLIFVLVITDPEARVISIFFYRFFYIADQDKPNVT